MRLSSHFLYLSRVLNMVQMCSRVTILENHTVDVIWDLIRIFFQFSQVINTSWILQSTLRILGFSGGVSGKEPSYQPRRYRRCWLDSWVRKIPWKRMCNPLRYSCLENPMDRGAWQAAVHGVTKSRTRLKWLSTHAQVCYTHKTAFQVILWDDSKIEL